MDAYEKRIAYLSIQEVYRDICNSLVDVAAVNTSGAVNFTPGEEFLVRPFTVFHHPCQMTLRPYVNERGLFGKLTFERLVSKEKSVVMLEIYFDNLKNVTLSLETPNMPWNLGGYGHDVARVVNLIIDAFFNSIEGEDAGATH